MQNTAVVLAEIQRVNAEVKKLRIVESAVRIAKLGKKTMSERSDNTIITHDFSDDVFHIHRSNYRYGPEYVNIDYRGQRVFEADFEEQMKGRISGIRAHKFLSGPWVSELDVKKFIATKRAKEKEKKAQRKLEERLAKKNRPLTQQEITQAERLGLIAPASRPR